MRKLTFNIHTGELEISDRREKIEQAPLDYKIKIIKHAIMIFLHDVNGDYKKELPELYSQIEQDLTIKDLTLFQFRKRLTKLEEGYTNEYIKELGDLSDKKYIRSRT